MKNYLKWPLIAIALLSIVLIIELTTRPNIQPFELQESPERDRYNQAIRHDQLVGVWDIKNTQTPDPDFGTLHLFAAQEGFIGFMILPTGKIKIETLNRIDNQFFVNDSFHGEFYRIDFATGEMEMHDQDGSLDAAGYETLLVKYIINWHQFSGVII